MNNKSLMILVVVLLFAGQWQCGEAIRTNSVVTRKDKVDPRHCDTFFHTRNVSGKKEYRAALHGVILKLVRNSSTHESAIQITDGQRLLKLHYGGRYGEAAVSCDVFPRPAAVASFLREFGIHVTSSDDFSRGICVNVDHILDEAGGSVMDPTDWNIQSINIHTMRDDSRQKCGGDHKLTAFMQKLDEAISSVTDQQQQQYLTKRSGVRSRRSVQVIMPGTRWCGTGNVSTAGESHGTILATDRCCQQHDRCSHTIEAFSRKYGLFNYRFHTISHCECDDMFRSCLRTVGSEEARMVGQLFFNIIGTKCFVLRVRRESVCAQRAWWGGCIREEMVNNEYAELRGPLSF